MNLAPAFFFLPPVFLYAEVHFRLFGLWSRYFMKEPEIVADLPFRLRAGEELPLLLMVKDAHRFPIVLHGLSISARRPSQPRRLVQAFMLEEKIAARFYHRLFACSLPPLRGEIEIDVEIEYTVAGKRRRCRADNYRLSSHSPFRLFVDDHPWPRLPGWYFGETHCHTLLSEDQVEFGAPFEALPAMARALELDFVALTDHSYDLDDSEENYLLNDPRLPKWQRLQEAAAALNASPGPLIIPGEELSAADSRGRNVHLLIYNNRRFYEGSGDGAERLLPRRGEHALAQLLPLPPEEFAAAAHPHSVPPLLQRLLLRRGHWRDDDLMLSGLNAAQFWNGDKEAFLKEGLRRWTRLLLRGRRLTLIAGNDAHGNFNRFRQVGTPHLTLREEEREVFGRARTSVRIDGPLRLETVLDALRRGRAVCSDGPMAAFELENNAGRFGIGDESPSRGALTVNLRSSPAFGRFARVDLVIGELQRQKETRRRLSPPAGSFESTLCMQLNDLPSPGYLRLEAETDGPGRPLCCTNPLYLR